MGGLLGASEGGSLSRGGGGLLGVLGGTGGFLGGFDRSEGGGGFAWVHIGRVTQSLLTFPIDRD